MRPPSASCLRLTAVPSLILTLLVSVLQADPGTGAQRTALLDYLIEKTAARDAFSPAKNVRLKFDGHADMLALRNEFAAADTDDKLYYAIAKASAARRDRHLSVDVVPGGLRPWFIGPDGNPVATTSAPVRLMSDFETFDVFVADLANDPSVQGIAVGDVVTSIDGVPTVEAVERARVYLRHSTEFGFRWHTPQLLVSRTPDLPATVSAEKIRLGFTRVDGTTYQVELPFRPEAELTWAGHFDRRYPGFRLNFERQTYKVYEHTGGRPVLLLQWYGFREDLVKDMDHLTRIAAERGWLNHDLIIDATRSRGGSLGAYALQKMSPRSFRTTFGNLRLSDVVPAFIAEREKEFAARNVSDSGVAETVDDGTWQIEWLRTDVRRAIASGQRYTNNVPFKSAHLPPWSDGILDPAPQHFTGRMAVLLGPQGGSHLDQFAAMVKDNALGVLIGMPAGGYSNTWEWTETLTLPGTDKPLASFMWSIGHTLTPHGEIMEGNPSPPDIPLLLTRENSTRYHGDLIQAAFDWLDGKTPIKIKEP